MKKVNLFFLVWWLTFPSSFLLTWSFSINSMFSAKDFLKLTVGTDRELLDTIANGVQTAMDECQKAFHWDRWNCPKTDFSRNQKQYLTKEQAVVQSIIAAGITFAIIKNCSRGAIPGCGCGEKESKFNFPSTMKYINDKYKYLTEMKKNDNVDFVLKSCETDIDFAESILKNMLDEQITGDDIQAKINLHNYDVGRRLVIKNLDIKCRCHGVSGSCNMQSCYTDLGSFSNIAKRIRNKYHRAEGIELGNDNRLPFQNFQDKIENKNAASLLFLDQSQNFCLPNIKTGWLGTKGRSCSREKLDTTTIAERKSCGHLCKSCGYKVRKTKRFKSFSCNCKFRWCCDVKCDTCNEMVNEFYCH